MKRIVLTGSASYLPDWWERNKHKLHNYEVHSINTSILITKDLCKMWWYSTDFFIHHPEISRDIIPIDRHCMCIHPDINNNTHDNFIKYNKGRTSGTMLFNVLEKLANMEIMNHSIEEVNVIGCDLVYKDGENNHFYPNGKADPMRLGVPLLQENIEFFRHEYNRLGILLYNLSTDPKSLLTFHKKELF